MVEDVSDAEFETVVVEKPPSSTDNGDSTHAPSGVPGGHSTKQQPRLLLASSRARNVALFPSSIAKDVVLVTYKYETSTLDTILGEAMSLHLGQIPNQCIIS